MKALNAMLSLVFAAGFIQAVAGKSCDSMCAACCKTGQKGVDTKFTCIKKATDPSIPEAIDCGTNCPAGYGKMHCAKQQRC